VNENITFAGRGFYLCVKLEIRFLKKSDFFHFTIEINIEEKMAYDLNADNVFEMAEQIESNGVKFYQAAANSTDNEGLKDFLNHMAKMEIVHQNIFKSLRGELSNKEKAATVFDPNEESTLYLQAIVDSRVSFENEFQFTSVESILKAAIESEKDTVIFYLGMKEAVPEDLGKNKIDRIIKEEMGHIRILTQKLVELKRNSG
jgi:rubrerythrin